MMNRVFLTMISKFSKLIYIYIYIYINKIKKIPHVRKYEIFPSSAFYTKTFEIFSSATSKIRTN